MLQLGIGKGHWKMEKEGAQQLELAEKDDKRQLTGVFHGSMVDSMAGHCLPVKLIYQRKTMWCGT